MACGQCLQALLIQHDTGFCVKLVSLRRESLMKVEWMHGSMMKRQDSKMFAKKMTAKKKVAGHILENAIG